jgi:hypothetical protein
MKNQVFLQCQLKRNVHALFCQFIAPVFDEQNAVPLEHFIQWLSAYLCCLQLQQKTVCPVVHQTYFLAVI